jgi:hypothetical protein
MMSSNFPSLSRYPLELLDEELDELDEEELDGLDDEEELDELDEEDELEELDEPDELDELEDELWLEELEDATWLDEFWDETELDELPDETELHEELLDEELLTLLLLLLVLSAEEETDVVLYDEDPLLEENVLAVQNACSLLSTCTAAMIAPPTFKVSRLNRRVAKISGVSAPANILEAAGANGKSIQANFRSRGDGVEPSFWLGDDVDLSFPFQDVLPIVQGTFGEGFPNFGTAVGL